MKKVKLSCVTLLDLPVESIQEILLFLYVDQLEDLKLCCSIFKRIIETKIFCKLVLRKQKLRPQLPLFGLLDYKNFTYSELELYIIERACCSGEKILKPTFISQITRFIIHKTQLYRTGIRSLNNVMILTVINCRCTYYFDFELKNGELLQKNNIFFPTTSLFCSDCNPTKITFGLNSNFLKLIKEQMIKSNTNIHPILVEWKMYYKKRGFVVKYKTENNACSFFIGVKNCKTQ